MKTLTDPGTKKGEAYTFNKNEISKHAQKLLMTFSDKVLTQNEALKLKKHLREYHKVYFLKILEDNKTAFEKLSTFFSTESYDEVIVNLKHEAYREMLSKQFYEVTLNDSKGLKLSDIYIEPEFNIHRSCFLPKDTRIKRGKNLDDKGFVKIESGSIHDFVHKFLLGKYGFDLKNKNANILFLLGYPGQGKSSFCKKLLYDTIAGSRIVDSSIYLIKFRSITNTSDLIYSPVNTLFEHLSSQLDFELSKADLRNSILVLDGLDELFMKENLQISNIDEFCRVLIREIESNDFPKIIITSRYGYVNTERLKTENALILQLRELDLERQVRWLEIYRKFHPETLLTVEKLTKINRDDRYLYLKELINQPILLHLIASLEEEIQINTNRAKIYGDLFTQLISRNWAKEGQIDNLVGIDQNDLRDFLREIAFEIFLSGNEYINKSTLTALPSARKFIEKMQNRGIQDSLKRIMIAFYFQEVKKGEKDESNEDKNDYAIEFLHKSLQEYLVAEKIWNSIIFLTDKNLRTGKYHIDDEKRAFEIINSLFSRKYLSKEISAYLIEIIKNDFFVDKKILAERLEIFLPVFLEVDFLYRNEIVIEKNIVMQAVGNFNGYWLILSSCSQKRNFIPIDYKEKVAFFLRLLPRDDRGIDLSYQDLSGVNLAGVNLSQSNLFHADLSRANLAGADLTMTDLTFTDFEGADMYRVTFERAKCENTNFKNAHLTSAILFLQDLRSCQFEGANFKGTVLSETNLKDISFKNCLFEHTNFLKAKGLVYRQFCSLP